MKVINVGYITYEKDNKYKTVGTITKERDENTMEIKYCITVDPKRYKELAEFGLNPEEDDLITGVFLGNKTRIVYNKVPYFMDMRTADRRRCDIDLILKKRGLKTYNQFLLLLATEGRYPHNNWTVLRQPKNSIDLGEYTPAYTLAEED